LHHSHLDEVVDEENPGSDDDEAEPEETVDLARRCAYLWTEATSPTKRSMSTIAGYIQR
jgi:hypothetical protein